MHNQLTIEEIKALLGIIDRVEIKGSEAENILLLKTKLRMIGEETIEKQKATANVVEKMTGEKPEAAKKAK